MHRPLALVTASALALVSIASAQPPQTTPGMPPSAQAPPRDKPAGKTGTASIHGRIVSAENGAAIRRARVSLTPANPLDARATTTDLDGRFEFTELPAGTYRISASKGLFTTFEYGQRRHHDRGTPVELTDGQKAEKIDIRLPRGGVLAGVLLDDVGDPASGVRVSAMRQQFRNGKRVLTSTGRSVETNDLGQYRLYGLPPGTYFIAALPSSSNALVPMLSTPSGAPTYYPGTLSELEAQRVAARPGQESLVPDFTLVPSRLVKVTGTATNATGGPAQAVMLIASAQVPTGEAALPGMTMAMVQADGAFRLNNVAPGEYTLLATSMSMAGEQQVSSMPLTIVGEDISGLVLTTAKGFQVTGQIVFDEGAPPSGMSPGALLLMAAPSSQTAMSGSVGRVAIREDWTFEAKGMAGERRFQFGQGLPAGWMIQSVTHQNDDITDKPLNVLEDLQGVVITLTKRTAGLGGMVTDSAGKPVTDCTIVVFPDDAAQGPPHSQRYLRALRPGEDGRFRVQQLPAATYLLVALEGLEAGDEHDPDLLEQLRPLATRISLGWGETREVPLRLVAFERRF